MQDASAPPVEELANVINYIDKEIQDRKPVIIHCNGVVEGQALCWLGCVFNDERKDDSQTSSQQGETAQG